MVINFSAKVNPRALYFVGLLYLFLLYDPHIKQLLFPCTELNVWSF